MKYVGSDIIITSYFGLYLFVHLQAGRILKVFHQPFLKEQKTSVAQGMVLKG